MSPRQCRISNYIQGKTSIKIPDKALENVVQHTETLPSKTTALTRPRRISNEGEIGKGEKVQLNFRI